MEESFSILPNILKNQEQIYNDNEEEASVLVIDKDTFTITGVFLQNDEANNVTLPLITKNAQSKQRKPRRLDSRKILASY